MEMEPLAPSQPTLNWAEPAVEHMGHVPQLQVVGVVAVFILQGVRVKGHGLAVHQDGVAGGVGGGGGGDGGGGGAFRACGNGRTRGGAAVVDGGLQNGIVIALIVIDADGGPLIGSSLIVNVGKACALHESAVFNAGHAGGDRDAGQAGTSPERAAPNAGYAAGNGDAGQLLAIKEGGLLNGGQAAGERNIGQAGAVAEHAAAKSDHAVRDRDAGQAGTACKRARTDTGDAAWDGDAGQAGIALKCIVVYGLDRRTVYINGRKRDARVAAPITGDGLDGILIVIEPPIRMKVYGYRKKDTEVAVPNRIHRVG